jgi:hypothetical protein
MLLLASSVTELPHQAANPGNKPDEQAVKHCQQYDPSHEQLEQRKAERMANQAVERHEQLAPQ